MPELADYRSKRNAGRTPEPIPEADPSPSPEHAGAAFVVQEHHARALHWDFRLERDGVLVSWAVPKGLPTEPGVNRLAVQTEDHPLEYAAFEGTIGAGEYGGGTVTIWDHGTYDLQKWTEREVKFVLTGARVRGRFVLIHTGGKNWLMHRMDSAQRQDWAPLPKDIAPMLATLTEPPAAGQSTEWAFEMKWDGVRALARVEGGRARFISRNGADMTVSYPELHGLGARLGSTQVLLDGEIVAFDDGGKPSFRRLQKRMHVGGAADARRLAASEPVAYLIFDVLHLDGRSLINCTYSRRRETLEGLALDGEAWHTPAAFAGSGAQAIQVSKDQGLEGVIAKRLASEYLPGRRSPDWIKIKNIRTQEVVIGGWTPGAGRRAGGIGALLLGIPEGRRLRYVGKVGTGFTDAALAALHTRLGRLGRTSSPFVDVPRADSRDAHWVSARVVGEVAFTEWTDAGRLRHPAWRGLRPDKRATDVVLES